MTIIEQAVRFTVTDIGQIGKRDKAQLNRAVKAGLLKRELGGHYPRLKMIYCLPGFDVANEHAAWIDYMMSLEVRA